MADRRIKLRRETVSDEDPLEDPRHEAIAAVVAFTEAVPPEVAVMRRVPTKKADGDPDPVDEAEVMGAVDAVFADTIAEPDVDGETRADAAMLP